MLGEPVDSALQQAKHGPLLELVDVSKSFGPHRAVQSLTLQLVSGRTYALIGSSGCGKSTALRLMMGLIQPDAGSVHFLGERMAPRQASQLRRRIGYVVQDGGLFPHLTAEQNVSLACRHFGWKADRVNERLGELAELTHFPRNRLGGYPAQLSGGQCQRVSLMRALMMDPEVLLLDEPLGALDPMIRSELQIELRGIFRSLNKTVVFVTHDLNEAAFLADTIVLLRDGRVVQQGPLQELIDAPVEPYVTRFVDAQRILFQAGS